MPLYNDAYSETSPFGINNFLRSTQDVKTESYTLAASSVPAQTIDGQSNQKVLQPGTVLAEITSAAGTSTADDVGKVGPYSTDTAGVTDGRSNPANIVGILRTPVPWQLVYGDMEVAAVYEAAVVQGWCIEYTAAKPTGDVMSNATADAIKPDGAAKVNGVAILCKK